MPWFIEQVNDCRSEIKAVKIRSVTEVLGELFEMSDLRSILDPINQL